MDLTKRRFVYDGEMDDEEWRDANFSDVEIASANSINAHQPTAEQLIKAAEKNGTDGILESAILLNQWHFKKVATAVKRINGGK